METPVRYERMFHVAAADIDELDHVNNVVYLRWVQDVAVAHWESATSPAERAEIAWVVLRHEIDYKHPALPGDQVIARTWVGPPSAARFERHTKSSELAISGCSHGLAPCGARCIPVRGACGASTPRCTTAFICMNHRIVLAALLFVVPWRRSSSCCDRCASRSRPRT